MFPAHFLRSALVEGLEQAGLALHLRLLSIIRSLEPDGLFWS